MANQVLEDRRWLAVGQALIHEDYTVDQVHDLTKIDKWFLHKLMDIVETQHELEAIGSLFGLRKELMLKAKQQGFSDIQIALAVGCSEDEVRARRKSMGLKPWVKKIDTLAAEFPAEVCASPPVLRVTIANDDCFRLTTSILPTMLLATT